MLAAILVFISYAHADRPVADRLRGDLERAGCAVWTDARLRPGQVWTREIEKAIDSADVVVTIMTPAAYKSDAVRAEQLRRLRKGGRLVPVKVTGADVPLHMEPLQWVPLTEVVNAVGCRK